MQEKINKILQVSRQILQDVSLRNGAIVAANTDHDYYPRTAGNYRYVWPRDAAYVCVAADYLNLQIQEPYFKWLESRPEDFKKEGLLFQNYSTNGRKHHGQFQPDQMGSSLWAIWHHFKDNLSDAKKFESLIKRLADGICNEWTGSYFFKNTCDLWEERHRATSTKIENNFTYSLAACAGGLEKALKIFPNNNNWEKTSKEMREKIEQSYIKKDGYFPRNFGKINDPNMDASLLGLVWPYEILDAADEKIANTIQRMEEKIVIEGGVHRYEMDYYDGEGTSQEGAGAWPLLNFWMSIYWKLAGNRKKSEQYFDWVVEKTDKTGLISEQIFQDFRKNSGITPLAWSHAMFVIAYYFLYKKDNL